MVRLERKAGRAGEMEAYGEGGLSATDRRWSNSQEATYPTLSVCTISGVCEDKVLELRPLCVESSNEFEGVYWVPQETLGIAGSCRRDKVQFVRPSRL